MSEIYNKWKLTENCALFYVHVTLLSFSQCAAKFRLSSTIANVCDDDDDDDDAPVNSINLGLETWRHQLTRFSFYSWFQCQLWTGAAASFPQRPTQRSVSWRVLMQLSQSSANKQTIWAITDNDVRKPDRTQTDHLTVFVLFYYVKSLFRNLLILTLNYLELKVTCLRA